jgi:hypothetical protein
MEKCEAYEDGRAILVENKCGPRWAVYCSVERGKCPYNNEGHRVEHRNSDRIICKSKGLVNQIGLLTFPKQS